MNGLFQTKILPEVHPSGSILVWNQPFIRQRRPQFGLSSTIELRLASGEQAEQRFLPPKEAFAKQIGKQRQLKQAWQGIVRGKDCGLARAAQRTNVGPQGKPPS